MLTDRNGLPLAVAVSAANTHDSLALIPLVQAVPRDPLPARTAPPAPVKLHADKGDDGPVPRIMC